jgi:hypothetical protein
VRCRDGPCPQPSKEVEAMDALFVGIILMFFGTTAGLVKLCERL